MGARPEVLMGGGGRAGRRRGRGMRPRGEDRVFGRPGAGVTPGGFPSPEATPVLTTTPTEGAPEQPPVGVEPGGGRGMRRGGRRSSGGGSGNKSSFKSAGSVLSQSEVRSIARSKGITPTDVMSKALDKGIGLGSKVVKNYNTPGGLGNYVYNGTPDNLNPLKDLSIPRGTAYYGATSYSEPSSPGSTTYNPIVMPRGGTGGGGGMRDERRGPLTPEQRQTRRENRIQRLMGRADSVSARSERVGGRAAESKKGGEMGRAGMQRERAERLKRKAEDMRARANRIRSRTAAPAAGQGGAPIGYTSDNTPVVRSNDDVGRLPADFGRYPAGAPVVESPANAAPRPRVDRRGGRGRRFR